MRMCLTGWNVDKVAWHLVYNNKPRTVLLGINPQITPNVLHHVDGKLDTVPQAARRPAVAYDVLVKVGDLVGMAAAPCRDAASSANLFLLLRRSIGIVHGRRLSLSRLYLQTN
jgi:hypothetical protein